VNLISVDSLEAKPIRHTDECQEETFPAFSPDGKVLAYVCTPQPGRFSLYGVDPAGGVPHLIGRYAGWAGGIAWSRDNQRLVISRPVEGDKFSELDEVSASDGRLRKLPFGEAGEAPASSAHGDKLAFEAWHFTGVDIWRRALILPGAAAAGKIVASSQASMLPQYSPDGKRLTFVSNRTGVQEIWMSNADGTGLVQISKLNNPSTGTPRWSPDSRRIVFDSRSGGRSGVYIVDSEERVPHRLLTNVEEMSQPSWSHDGKWIYFIGGGSSGRIFRCSTEGGEAEALSSQAGSLPQEAFGRDEVYFVTNLVGNPRLKVISLKKPGTESLVEGMPTVNFIDWAVVPRGIFFLPSDEWSLEYFDFAADKVSRVMEISSEPVMGISVSPDQHWIVYSRLQQADSDVMVVEPWR
jgi:Tol biopolymer transport system component